MREIRSLVPEESMITPTAARAAGLCDATTAGLEPSPWSSGRIALKFCAIDTLLGESGLLGTR
jgi:hypothetical protein